MKMTSSKTSSQTGKEAFRTGLSEKEKDKSGFLRALGAKALEWPKSERWGEGEDIQKKLLD